MTIPADYMHPEMMAIGDSLYQGVRSLTIKNGTNQLSAPALAAEALGIRHKFSCPDPKRPILVNMEAWLRMLPGIDAIKQDMAGNVDYWFARPASPSGRLLFENVAVASSTIADLYTATWQTSDDYLRGLANGTRGKIKQLKFDGLDLAEIVIALNARFTLNPSGKAAFKKLSQVDLAAARKPKRLLVNIGANNGLWDMAFAAKPGARMVFKADLRRLAARLHALPGEVEHIYFNNLGLPSTVPNLMPLPDLVEWEEGNKPGRGNYYRKYENRFGLAYGSLTGAQLRKLDERVALANQESQAILKSVFGTDRRLHFVDLAKSTRKYDAKHQRRTANNVIKLKNDKTITNVMLNAGLFGGFRRGGTQGLDGMHPTVVGYAIMAQQVLDAIKRAEPGTNPARIDLDDAFSRDKLLNDVPWVWNMGLWLWRDIRRAQAANSPEPIGDADDAAVRDVFATAGLAIRTGSNVA
ncbi:MAG: hypothetical protein QGF20_09340 [Alphaproteobacteria bacterium]|nr:hypothetical protein [Alphaproteobacteria bacterium]